METAQPENGQRSRTVPSAHWSAFVKEGGIRGGQCLLHQTPSLYYRENWKSVKDFRDFFLQKEENQHSAQSRLFIFVQDDVLFQLFLCKPETIPNHIFCKSVFACEIHQCHLARAVIIFPYQFISLWKLCSEHFHCDRKIIKPSLKLSLFRCCYLVYRKCRGISYNSYNFIIINGKCTKVRFRRVFR